MKGIATAVLGCAAVVYVLLSLLAADSSPDRTSSVRETGEQTISDIGLRFGWHR